MRILLGLAALALLFLLAGEWQRRTVRDLGGDRPPGNTTHAAERAAGLTELGEGWSMLLVGAPSGAEPWTGTPGQPDGVPGGAPPTTPGSMDSGQVEVVSWEAWEELESRAIADFEREVQSGESLSRIAELFYESAAPDLVERLAEYNGIEDPDQLRAGHVLFLPSREKLGLD